MAMFMGPIAFDPATVVTCAGGLVQTIVPAGAAFVPPAVKVPMPSWKLVAPTFAITR
jgi:hypothetical protein